MASTERMTSPTLAAVAPPPPAATAAEPSPPAVAIASATAAPVKKRKASGAPSGCRETGSTSTHCSLCGFGASTLDHLLTHVREAHDRSHEAASPMALPLQVAQMVVQRALDQAALGGATSAWLSDMQHEFAAAAELATALERRDAHGVATAVGRLHGGTRSGDERTLSATLQQAAQILLRSLPAAPTGADASSVAVVAIKQEEKEVYSEAGGAVAGARAGAIDVDDAAEGLLPKGKDSSIHEAEAAQALTGLRATASSSATTTEATMAAAPVATATSSVWPPAAPKPTPMAPQASFPSFTLGSPLSITAPTLQLSSPHFPSSDGVYTGASARRSPGTQSSLPSLFARSLLAPLASPSSVADPGNGLAQGVATDTGYMNPMMVTDHRNSLGSTLRPEPTSAFLTPVYYSSFPTFSTTTAGAMHGTPTMNRPTLASPVKRKSITSKQLIVRCDAEVAAVRAATSTAAGADTSGLASLGSISVSGTPTTPATRKATPRRWTKEEDDALRSAVENHREKNWKAIAAQVPGRNHTQCLQRWTKVLAPGLVKGHWSPHEDELLRRLVATEQKNWGDVASKIPGRTSKQCRERWHNHLDPQIVRGAYTPEEDRLILEAQARLGNRWSVIAAMLPGRTEDAVKIRWKSHCRLWRARKYLRKNPNSDVDMMSEPTQTPRTPLVPPTGDFKWPVPFPCGAVDEHESNAGTDVMGRAD
ncbi:unnamed protein product [Hyaloperonospora brassicae]|uniref:Uncharacterized protein n=1 Tax=Hyaloperonospora brassicae TaxID=162125 RepID=A0AAV0UB97_HYABA|nr:unnamed protein product [Hyaloperonospora brassicae]